MSASPDGAWLVLSQNVDGEIRIVRVPTSGGPIQPVTQRAGSSPRWSPDGRWIFFMREDDVWRVAQNGEGERPVTNLKGRRGFLRNLDVDERYIYFSWREDVSDIWVMDLDHKK